MLQNREQNGEQTIGVFSDKICMEFNAGKSVCSTPSCSMSTLQAFKHNLLPQPQAQQQPVPCYGSSSSSSITGHFGLDTPGGGGSQPPPPPTPPRPHMPGDRGDKCRGDK